MKRLKIRNFGPIRDVELEIKRLNVILGPQSSGKSTVLKVACFCDWMERQISLTQNPEKYCNPKTFYDNLIGFHKLEGFMHPDSYIKYENDVLAFEYDANLNRCKFDWAQSPSKRWGYKRAKISYIPSERNLVAAITNWYQVSMDNNNILDFMKEWEFARKSFTKKESILNLPYSYRYDVGDKGDKIVMPGGLELNMTNASSGLQSLTPLCLMLRYLTDGYYKEKHTKVEEAIFRDNLELVVQRECADKSPEKQKKIIDGILTPCRTDFFIEEPESHIFPSTQKEFVYSLVGLLNGRRKHSCFISTHSPYILTAMNNLIQASDLITESKEKADRVKERFPLSQAISYDNVAAFFMKDGRIESIMDPDFRLISSEALDSASQEIADDFNFLLNI
ncbi:MAG: AAA family ATPase [Candidatus Cryptobacteroides sp.]